MDDDEPQGCMCTCPGCLSGHCRLCDTVAHDRPIPAASAPGPKERP
jgi:hypothetical protein